MKAVLFFGNAESFYIIETYGKPDLLITPLLNQNLKNTYYQAKMMNIPILQYSHENPFDVLDYIKEALYLKELLDPRNVKKEEAVNFLLDKNYEILAVCGEDVGKRLSKNTDLSKVKETFVLNSPLFRKKLMPRKKIMKGNELLLEFK